MLVDEYEQYHNDRTDDVVVSRSGSEEPEPEPLADDCKIVYHAVQMLYTFPHLFKRLWIGTSVLAQGSNIQESTAGA
jgi:hypothetical protein